MRVLRGLGCRDFWAGVAYGASKPSNETGAERYVVWAFGVDRKLGSRPSMNEWQGISTHHGVGGLDTRAEAPQVPFAADKQPGGS